MDTAKLQDRIEKLLALGRNNGNEAEAMAAMAKAQALMLQHGISEEQLGRKHTVGYGKFMNTDLDWHTILAHACNALYGTNHVEYARTGQIRFVGRDSTLMASENTLVFLIAQTTLAYKKRLPPQMTKSERARYRREFKRSCAYMIYLRAKELEAEPTITESGGSTALVVQHQKQLREETTKFIEGDGVPFKGPRQIALRESDATLAGTEEGAQIPLHQELDHA